MRTPGLVRAAQASVPRRLFLLGAAATTLVPRAAWGAVAAAASEHDYPPYMFNMRGRRHGFDVEKVNMVLDAMRYRVVHEAMDRSAILPAVDDLAVDFAFSFSSSPERTQKYLLVGPLHVRRTAFAVRPDDLREPMALGAVLGRRIGTVDGHHYPDALTDAAKFTLVPCSSTVLALRRLASGLVDAVVGERSVLAWVVKSQGLERHVRVSQNDLDSAPSYCLFSKARAPLATAFAAALHDLEAAGKFAELEEKFATGHAGP